MSVLQQNVCFSFMISVILFKMSKHSELPNCRTVNVNHFQSWAGKLHVPLQSRKIEVVSFPCTNTVLRIECLNCLKVVSQNLPNGLKRKGVLKHKTAICFAFVRAYAPKKPVQIFVYYINTSEIPSELSRENFISSHVKITCYLHT